MVTSDLRPMGSQTQRADLVPFRFFKLSRPRRAFDESPVGLILINLAVERDILASQLPTATITYSNNYPPPFGARFAIENSV